MKVDAYRRHLEVHCYNKALSSPRGASTQGVSPGFLKVGTIKAKSEPDRLRWPCVLARRRKPPEPVHGSARRILHLECADLPPTIVAAWFSAANGRPAAVPLCDSPRICHSSGSHCASRRKSRSPGSARRRVFPVQAKASP